MVPTAMSSEDEMVPTKIPSPPQSARTEIGDGEESASLPGSPVSAAACIDQPNPNIPRRKRSCHELDDPAVVDMGADELARIGRTPPAPVSQGTL